jgi:glycosyltransferase involved in cell wall biosynthesis
MSTQGIVLLLAPSQDTKGTTGPAFIERHRRYAKELHGADPKNPILTIGCKSSSSPGTLIVNEPDFKVFSLGINESNFIKVAQIALATVKSNAWGIHKYVCGNPWESFFPALLMKYVFQLRANMQIQYHGCFYEKAWLKISLKNQLMYLLAKFSILFGDSFRFVTNEQMQEMIKRNSKLSNKSFAVPLPSPIPTTTLSNSSADNVIGYLGRIHPERNPKLWLASIKKLNLTRQDFKCVIAGSGLNEEKFIAELINLLGPNRISFKGHVSANQLENFWNEITILLSTSGIESYGLAIREAILRGKKCVAVTSVGARDAKENFGEAITLTQLDPSSIAQSIAIEIEAKKTNLNLEGIRNKQEILNALYVTELVNSWR